MLFVVLVFIVVCWCFLFWFVDFGVLGVAVFVVVGHVLFDVWCCLSLLRVCVCCVAVSCCRLIIIRLFVAVDC